MIPLIVLLLSIEVLPDGEARIRFTPERPVARAGGQIAVELDESVFGEITGFEVFGAAGAETAAALIEGRKAQVAFGSNSASIGAIADRPLLTLRTRAIGNPSFAAVKVTVAGSAWRIEEGSVPSDVPEERFATVPAGRFQVQLPKHRIAAGEGGPFRGLASGGLVIRNPQPYAVNVLFQATGLLREVTEESRFTLLPGESSYRNGPIGYGRFFASAEIEMAAIRWQVLDPGPVVSLSASPMTPLSGSRLIEWTTDQTSLAWRWQEGATLPRPVVVRLTADNSPVLQPRFRVSATARWLQVTPGARQFSVSVDPRGLTAGVYRDTITVEPVPTEFFGVGKPLRIGAVLTVSNEPEHKLSFRSRTFPLFHLERFQTSEPAAAFTATVYPEAARTWLSAIPMGGFFQGTVAVASNGDLLGPGYYGGHVVLNGAHYTDVVQVTTMRPGGALIETTAAARFTMSVGGKTPEAQRLPVLSPGPFSATVQTDNGGNWLTAVVEAGALTLSANAAGLRAGAYTGMVTLRAASAAGPRQIPVALLIYPNPAAALVASPAMLDLRTTLGVSPATSIAVQSGLLVEPLQWIAEMDAGASGWLAVDPGEQAAGVRTDVSRLPVGVYTGRVTARTSMQSVVIPVRLTVSEPAVTDESPYLGVILNAASWRESPIAAGEEVTLHGGFIQGVSLDGIPVAARRFVVPPELAGRPAVTLRLWNGKRFTDSVVPLADAAPGVYTEDGSGKGLAIVRNANGGGHPVQRGTVVWLQATGLKRDDIVVDVGGVQVRAMNVFPLVEGSPGRDWIEFVMPADAPVGEVPVTVVSAGVRSQKGVTMYVE